MDSNAKVGEKTVRGREGLVVVYVTIGSGKLSVWLWESHKCPELNKKTKSSVYFVY